MKAESERPSSHLSRKTAASACLAGHLCRYDGASCMDPVIARQAENGETIPLCPERMGGLKTPRTPCEIVGGDGFDVLDGRARVMDRDGEDRTSEFLAGARAFLACMRTHGAETAILKEKSPSCGTQEIYDGTFSGKTRPGPGVTTALLLRNGILVTDPSGLTPEPGGLLPAAQENNC